MSTIIRHYLMNKYYLNKGVNCKTKEDAIEFLNIMRSLGYLWSDSIYNASDSWEKDTCYYIRFKRIMFSSKTILNANSVKVIGFHINDFKYIDVLQSEYNENLIFVNKWEDINDE